MNVIISFGNIPCVFFFFKEMGKCAKPYQDGFSQIMYGPPNVFGFNLINLNHMLYKAMKTAPSAATRSDVSLSMFKGTIA